MQNMKDCLKQHQQKFLWVLMLLLFLVELVIVFSLMKSNQKLNQNVEEIKAMQEKSSDVNKEERFLKLEYRMQEIEKKINDQKPKTDSNSTDQSTTSSKGTDYQPVIEKIELSNIVYTNKEYGFSFRLPKGQEDYQVFIEKSEKDPKIMTVSIAFKVDEMDEDFESSYHKINGSYYYDTFIFDIYPKNIFTSYCQSSECKNNSNDLPCIDCSSKLGENRKYVFGTLWMGNDVPDALNDFYNQLRDESNMQIFQSGFKFF